MNIATDRAFKRYETTVKPFEVSTSLVTESVFRLSRNPMYLGMIFILLGVALFLGALAPFAVSVVFALLMRYRFVRIEERMLAEKFGAEWRRYSAQVRRWVWPYGAISRPWVSPPAAPLRRLMSCRRLIWLPRVEDHARNRT